MVIAVSSRPHSRTSPRPEPIAWPALAERAELRAEVARFDPELPIERAFTPPGSWYVDPRFFALDRQAVFGANWLYACRLDQLESPGAYAAGCVAGLPWVVVRGDDGQLRGYHNSCRHKGREVVTGSGVAAGALVCGYHAWSYGLDGRLRSAPRTAGIEDLDRDALSLVPLAVKVWGRWVFVHVDPAAATATPGLDALEDRLGERDLARVRHVHSAEWVVDANWKTVVDNYLDGGYHVPHMHPSLNAQLDMQSYRTELCGTGSIQTAGAGDGVERIGDGAVYAWLHPNFMINAYGPCIDTNVVLPVTHDRCKIVYDFYFATDDADFISASIAQSAVTQGEDKEICESVQIGLGSPSYDRGRYAPRLEIGEHHFHQLLAADYGRILGRDRG